MEKTVIAYYLGGHGPTIYIGVKSMEWLILLRNTITQLRDGVIDCVKFHQFKDIEIMGINTLKLIKATRDIQPCITLNGKEENDIDIVWSQDTNKLEYTLSMIVRLIERDTAEHQYLDEDGMLLIELSYKE